MSKDNIGNNIYHILARSPNAAAIYKYDYTAMNAMNIYLQTPLILACKWNNATYADLLIRQKVKIDAADCSGQMAIHHAAAAGNSQIVKSLTEAGANVNALSINSSTALHFALKGDSVEHENLTEMLLQYNADVFICNTKGIRPIDVIQTKIFRTTIMKEHQVKSLIVHGRLKKNKDIKSPNESATTFPPPAAKTKACRTRFTPL